MSDGVLDDEEWEALKSTIQSRVNEFQQLEQMEKEELVESLLSEFKFLIRNDNVWREKFLDTLEMKLITDHDDKEFVLESMYLFANVANGISDIEKTTIEYLVRRLKLSGK
ncbi:MAG: hypothetical protein MI865_12235, partial [Proteobacteria bacterium]|nr:hypothetical protein [Pseudomonadota bacterium]